MHLKKDDQEDQVVKEVKINLNMPEELQSMIMDDLQWIVSEEHHLRTIMAVPAWKEEGQRLMLVGDNQRIASVVCHELILLNKAVILSRAGHHQHKDINSHLKMVTRSLVMTIEEPMERGRDPLLHLEKILGLLEEV